jgi:hypothetical protein
MKELNTKYESNSPNSPERPPESVTFCNYNIYVCDYLNEEKNRWCSLYCQLMIDRVTCIYCSRVMHCTNNLVILKTVLCTVHNKRNTCTCRSLLLRLKIIIENIKIYVKHYFQNNFLKCREPIPKCTHPKKYSETFLRVHPISQTCLYGTYQLQLIRTVQTVQYRSCT